MKSQPLKPQFIHRAESPPQAGRNHAAKKYHGEFASLNFEDGKRHCEEAGHGRRGNLNIITNL